MKRMIILVLNYALGYLFVYPFIAIFILETIGIRSSSAIIAVQFAIYSMTMVISIIVAFPLLRESYMRWKINKTLIIRKNFKLLIMLYMTTFIGSFIISGLTNTTTSNNQAGVSTSIGHFPLLMMFATMIFAPIVEEILFRGVFYRSFRPRFQCLLATILSSTAFGLLHIYDSIISGQWSDCWYFLVYAMIGFFLCRSYEETDTIFGPILLHFLNNSIAFLLVFL